MRVVYSMKKAQVSSEFIVILGVVLVIAMVAIGLTLFFSQSSKDITENEARMYWSSQPRPLRVLDYSCVNGGDLSLLIENIDSKPINLTGFVVDSTNSVVSPDIEIAPAERIVYLVSGTPFCSGSETSFEGTLVINYSTPYFEDLNFEGIRPLRGSCGN